MAHCFASRGPFERTLVFAHSWEIQTKSDSRAYFEWLKNQVGPEYHVTSETTSALTLVKEIPGDSYSLNPGRRSSIGHRD